MHATFHLLLPSVLKRISKRDILQLKSTMKLSKVQAHSQNSESLFEVVFCQGEFFMPVTQKKNQQTAMLRARQYCNCLPEQPANQTSN